MSEDFTNSKLTSLDEEAKAKIRLEEIFRSEIRQELEKKSNTKQQKTIAFLNSNLFLWVAGAFFLSLVPFIWNKIEFYNKKKERIDQLDKEMAGRLTQLFENIQRTTDSSGFNEQNQEINVKDVIFQFKDPPDRSYKVKYYPLYKEFDTYSTITILTELSTLIGDQNERNRVKHISSLISSGKVIPLKNTLPSAEIPALVQRLKDSLLLSRWK